MGVEFGGNLKGLGGFEGGVVEFGPGSMREDAGAEMGYFWWV